MRIKLYPQDGGEPIEVCETHAEFLISKGWRKTKPKPESKPETKPKEV